MSLEKFSAEIIRPLDPRGPTITYCADNQCDLSARLAARLIAENFSQVYEYAASLADWMAYGLPIEGEDAAIPRAATLAQRQFPTCLPTEKLADAAQRIGGHSLCAVIDEDGVLLGRLQRADFERSPRAVAREVMHPGPSTFRPDVTAEVMADWFERRSAEAFIITTPDGRPYGVLYRTDVERALPDHGR